MHLLNSENLLGEMMFEACIIEKSMIVAIFDDKNGKQLILMIGVHHMTLLLYYYNIFSSLSRGCFVPNSHIVLLFGI